MTGLTAALIVIGIAGVFIVIGLTCMIVDMFSKRGKK